jgi:hypothetical protein
MLFPTNKTPRCGQSGVPRSRVSTNLSPHREQEREGVQFFGTFQRYDVEMTRGLRKDAPIFSTTYPPLSAQGLGRQIACKTVSYPGCVNGLAEDWAVLVSGMPGPRHVNVLVNVNMNVPGIKTNVFVYVHEHEHVHVGSSQGSPPPYEARRMSSRRSRRRCRPSFL